MTTKNQDSLNNEFYFDEETAFNAVGFFEECLTHTTGEWAGKPFILEEWQAEIVSNIFGWKRVKDGTRKYRTVFIALPRKNGKTTFAAGLALYASFCDGELGGQAINAASDREQARLCFDVAKGMINNEPELEDRCKVYKNSIVIPNTGSSYKVVSSEAFSKHGLNLSYFGADELHAWPDPELWDVMTTSMGARRQPLTVVTTTAGYNRQSICYEQWDYARKVRDGVIQDDTYLPVLFEAEEGDNWEDPAVWERVNPNYGKSIKEEFLQGEYKKAKEMPRLENTFKNLYLNIWTEQETRWLSLDVWNDNGGDLPDLSDMACYGALDLSTTTDISAFVMVFRHGRTVYIRPMFFVPGDNVEKRSKRDRVPYDLWIKQGYIIATPGNVIDYDIIRNYINEMGDIYEIRDIAVDRWNATQIATQLQGDGFETFSFGQGFASMSGPSKELEKLLLGREICHGDNPVLRWMASNVAIEMDAAGNIKPSKKKSTERIDGIVALIMAIGRLISNDDDAGRMRGSGDIVFI